MPPHARCTHGIQRVFPGSSKSYFSASCILYFLIFPLVDWAPYMNNHEVMKSGCCRWFRKMSPETFICLKLWIKDSLWLLDKLTAGHLLFLILFTSILQKGTPDLTCHPDSLLSNWKLFAPNWLKRTPLPVDLEISHSSALDHLNCLIDQSIFLYSPPPTSEPWYRQRRWSSLTASQLLAGIVYISSISLFKRFFVHCRQYCRDFCQWMSKEYATLDLLCSQQ